MQKIGKDSGDNFIFVFSFMIHSVLGVVLHLRLDLFGNMFPGLLSPQLVTAVAAETIEWHNPLLSGVFTAELYQRSVAHVSFQFLCERSRG